MLENVAELENPDTVKTRVEAAAKETAVEDSEEKTLPVLVNPINFAELNAINPDIMGWIRIGALDISYPVPRERTMIITCTGLLRAWTTLPAVFS